MIKMIFCLNCRTKASGSKEGYYYCPACEKFTKFFTLRFK